MSLFKQARASLTSRQAVKADRRPVAGKRQPLADALVIGYGCDRR